MLVALAGMAMAQSIVSPASEQEGTKDQQGQRVVREGMFWVSENNLASPAGRAVHIHLDSGSVLVKGDSANGKINCAVKLRVVRAGEEQAKREIATYNTSVYHKGDTVYISGDFPSNPTSRLMAEFNISVPRDTDLVYVETRGGTVTAIGVNGRVDLSTAGGGVNADDIGGNIKVRTLGGSIGVGKAGGSVDLETTGWININNVKGNVRAVTHGGSVDVTYAGGTVNVEAMGGSITIRQSKGQVFASTAGGNIEIGDISSTAELRTMGGSISLKSAQGKVLATTAAGCIRLSNLSQGAVARTASGTIEADFIASPQAFSDSRLETTMGDIWVALPSELKVSVRASVEMANGHKIQTDFPGIKVSREGEMVPITIYADGDLNGGGPTLKVVATGGNITFSKK